MISRITVANLALACALFPGCNSSESGVTPAADSAEGSAESIDSRRTALSGLTLIAFYPLGSPHEEASEDLSEALDDFSHHLSAAGDTLRALGFRVETQ